MEDISINELVVVEYSLSQNAWHFSSVDDLIINSLTCIQRKHVSDYKVVAIFKDRETCDNEIGTLRNEVECLNKLESEEVKTFTISDLLNVGYDLKMKH